MSTVLAPPPASRDYVRSYHDRRFPKAHPYVNDPVGFCRDRLAFEPWSKQREILEAIRDNRRVAVRSSHGVGKSAIAARAALWFLATRPGKTKVITTGATWRGVKTILWPEISSAYRHVEVELGGKLTNTELVIADERFAIGISTDKPESFQGQHADHLLLIVDEASGIPEPIFEAAAGYMTGDDAHTLLIGNPTQLAGEFYEAFHSKSAQYATFNISAFDTPAFTGEKVSDSAQMSLGGIKTYAAEMLELYGKDSPVYQIRVMGNFPTTADDTVCALGDVEEAHANAATAPFEPMVIGCDVARFGSDESVIALRQGSKVRIVARYVGKDLMHTVGEILNVARAATRSTPYPESMTRIVIDDTGVGGGVTDRLNEILQKERKGTFTVVPFNGGNKAWTENYPNRRSELWFSFSDRLTTLDLDPADKKLTADLVAPRYALDSQGRRVVERKSETKKRLSRSPDSADGVLLTFAVPDVMTRPAMSQGTSITSGLMDRKW